MSPLNCKIPQWPCQPPGPMPALVRSDRPWRPQSGFFILKSCTDDTSTGRGAGSPAWYKKKCRENNAKIVVAYLKALAQWQTASDKFDECSDLVNCVKQGAPQMLKWGELTYYWWSSLPFGNSTAAIQVAKKIGSAYLDEKWAVTVEGKEGTTGMALWDKIPPNASNSKPTGPNVSLYDCGDLGIPKFMMCLFNGKLAYLNETPTKVLRHWVFWFHTQQSQDVLKSVGAKCLGYLACPDVAPLLLSLGYSKDQAFQIIWFSVNALPWLGTSAHLDSFPYWVTAAKSGKPDPSGSGAGWGDWTPYDIAHAVQAAGAGPWPYFQQSASRPIDMRPERKPFLDKLQEVGAVYMQNPTVPIPGKKSAKDCISENVCASGADVPLQICEISCDPTICPKPTPKPPPP